MLHILGAPSLREEAGWQADCSAVACDKQPLSVHSFIHSFIEQLLCQTPWGLTSEESADNSENVQLRLASGRQTKTFRITMKMFP